MSDSRSMPNLQSLASSALDWLYPRRCMICQDLLEHGRGDWFCASCLPILEPVSGPVCEKCGRPLCGGEDAGDGALCAACEGKKLFFGKNTAFFPYDPVVREMIHRFKYGERPRYALGFASMIYGLTDPEFWKKADAFVPVPMYPKKKRERGFNQAEELAKAVSRLTGVPVIHDYLLRAADTRPQSGLSPVERANNVKDAFRTDKRKAPAAKSLLIFDDIYTTGETMSACAKVLLDAGAERADGFTLAITIGRNKGGKDDDDTA